MQDRLDTVIEPAIIAMGYEYVGCQFLQEGQGQVLRVYVDSTAGVSIDACGQLSRQVASVLDVEDVIKSSYRLEVSSPGIDRPLFKLAHYEQSVGREVKFRLRVALDERRNFVAKLTGVEDSMLHFDFEGEPLTVDFSDIEKAKLTLDF